MMHDAAGWEGAHVERFKAAQSRSRERLHATYNRRMLCVHVCVRVCVHVTCVCVCMYAHVFIYKYTGYCTCVRTVPMYSTPYNGTFYCTYSSVHCTLQVTFPYDLCCVTDTGATAVGDGEWGHLQIDATSLYLLTLAQDSLLYGQYRHGETDSAARMLATSLSPLEH